MKPVRTFSVIPSLPPQLEPLRDIAQNLHWTWDPEAIALFRRLDEQLWEQSGLNPVRMLGMIDQSRLEAIVNDEGFLVRLDRVKRALDAYLASRNTWFARRHGRFEQPQVAYFSPEVGITDCLNIFAGGLGLLAGDHLKSASDVGVPLVAVSLMYQEGYFRQTLNDGGWQQEFAEDNDFHNLPLSLERNEDGTPVLVSAPHGDHEIQAQIWCAQVGRISLYLLDTNIDANSLADRNVTDQLYGGDLEMRIRQEIVLGIGGRRALRALGIDPLVYHMNEGHSAFLALERISELMQSNGMSFDEALEASRAGTVFTTHTPVRAGHDAFPTWLMERYLGTYAAGIGLSVDALMALGRVDANNTDEPFGMTVLALRTSDFANGVSRLHGVITREMWQALWPGLPVSEVPIGHITNGVHLSSWVSDEHDANYDRYLGTLWRNEPTGDETWALASRIPDEEMWRIHERRRSRLIVFARRRLRAQLEHRGVSEAEIERASTVLNPEALTIGFARRFATYKRANLLLRDPDRLSRLITNPERPVQFIVAGKAHPRDDAGKELIRQIVAFSRRPEIRGHVIFLEDYDIETARFLVQGCDVWLNNPRRPQEASGTSGMKAAANGVLNFSTLDGWWDEAWDATRDLPAPVGWAIGRGEEYDDTEYQDQMEANDIYNVLEQDIVPLFYERDEAHLPHGWVQRMKSTVMHLGGFVSAHRMVEDYVEQMYLPAMERARTMRADNFTVSRSMASWRSRLEAGWGDVGVVAVENNVPLEVRVGEPMQARARVSLGALRPDDVAVQMYVGRLDANNEIVGAESARMELVSDEGNGVYLFESPPTPWRASGMHGYTVRVMPDHPNLHHHFLPGLVAWAAGS